MRRILLVLSLTGFAVLASATDAFAQRIRIGVGGGYGPSISLGTGGGYYGPSGYNNSYYGNRNYGNSYYGGRGYSPYYQGFGVSVGPGYYQPYYGSRVIGSSDYYTTPSYVVGPAGSSYAAPATQSFYAGPGVAQRSALVRVLVPNADAEVWFDDTATEQRGTQRSFESSSLEPNRDYSYTVKAKWMENGQPVTRQREVSFQAGMTVTVDLREAPREKVPAPATKTPLRK